MIGKQATTSNLLNKYIIFDIRPHFFDLLDYVTRQSEKLRFQKKKKKKKGFRDPAVRILHYCLLKMIFKFQ